MSMPRLMFVREVVSWDMSAVRKDRSMDSSSGGWLTDTGSVPVGDAISIFTVGKSVAFNPPFDLATAASAAAGELYCLKVAPLAVDN